MELWKTTILPADDPALSREILEDLIHEEPYVLLIVLGTSDEARRLAERGSKNAGAKGEPWWVVWVRDPASVQDVLDGLGNPNGLDTTGALGILLTFGDDVHTVFTQVPTNLKLLTEYVKAGSV